MSYKLTYTANISWVGDGPGPIGFNPDGPTLQFSGSQVMAGTAAVPLTTASILTATTAMGTDIDTQATAAATLARLQGFANGTTQ